MKFIDIAVPVTFLSIGCLHLGMLGFKSEQYFLHAYARSVHIYLQQTPWFVCLVYSLS